MMRISCSQKQLMIGWIFADGVDGFILFSDILTPLPAMGIDFSISENGGITIDPIRCQESRKRLNSITIDDYRQSCTFVGSVLRSLREKVKKENTCTVLGFVGLPFTVGSYLIEGKTGVATEFAETKSFMEANPTLVHDIFQCLATNIGEYACYQIENGAQVIQVFDSWAGHVDDDAYDVFCLPYQKQVIDAIQQRHPQIPVIIYMAPGPFSKGGRRLLKLAETGADVISIDHTIDIEDACQILPRHLGVQGNLDPQLLRDGPHEAIEDATIRILKSVVDRPHIMNLGHGILADTPESNAATFVNTVHRFRRSASKSIIAQEPQQL